MALSQHHTLLLSALIAASVCSSALGFLSLPGFPTQEQVDMICGDRVHLLNENGTSADECIFGTNGDEVLYGNGGSDVIFGLGGDDYLVGGNGNDTLYGGAGDDTIFAGSGEDVIFGDGGDDKLYGGPNDDSIFGGSGVDEIFGGLGDDLIQGQGGDDTLYGEEGFDKFSGGQGVNTLFVDLSENIPSNTAGEDVITFDEINALQKALGELQTTVDSILAERAILKSEIDLLQAEMDQTTDKLEQCLTNSSTPAEGTVVDIVYQEFNTFQSAPFTISAMPGATSVHCSLTFISIFGGIPGAKNCNLVFIDDKTWQFSEAGESSVQCRAICANFFQA